MGPENSRKIVNLALQGGGSHGAFTWGVLDRLLEEERKLMASPRPALAQSMQSVWPMACLGRTRRCKGRSPSYLEKNFQHFSLPNIATYLIR